MPKPIYVIYYYRRNGRWFIYLVTPFSLVAKDIFDKLDSLYNEKYYQLRKIG